MDGGDREQFCAMARDTVEDVLTRRRVRFSCPNGCQDPTHSPVRVRVQLLIAVPEGVRIYLALGATAIRKSLDGLTLLVQETLKLGKRASIQPATIGWAR